MVSLSALESIKEGERTPPAMRIRGKVSSGLGRAHIFMAQTHYQEQFRNILGSTAWPGTLNVNLENDNLEKFVALRKLSGMETADMNDEIQEAALQVPVEGIQPYRVQGFSREGRSFGGATSFLANISFNDEVLPCAVIIPDLTRHTDVVEIIANAFLREALSISDGDCVEVNLTLTD